MTEVAGEAVEYRFKGSHAELRVSELLYWSCSKADALRRERVAYVDLGSFQAAARVDCLEWSKGGKVRYGGGEEGCRLRLNIVLMLWRG